LTEKEEEKTFVKVYLIPRLSASKQENSLRKEMSSNIERGEDGNSSQSRKQ
jgi:hypothetical protein